MRNKSVEMDIRCVTALCECCDTNLHSIINIFMIKTP